MRAARITWRKAQTVIWLAALALMPFFTEPPIFPILAFVAIFLFPFNLGAFWSHSYLPASDEPPPSGDPVQLRLRPYESDQSDHAASGSPTPVDEKREEGPLREPLSPKPRRRPMC